MRSGGGTGTEKGVRGGRRGEGDGGGGGGWAAEERGGAQIQPRGHVIGDVSWTRDGGKWSPFGGGGGGREREGRIEIGMIDALRIG